MLTPEAIAADIAKRVETSCREIVEQTAGAAARELPQLRVALATRDQEIGNQKALIDRLKVQLSDAEHRVYVLERDGERQRQFSDAQVREIERLKNEVANADDRARASAAALASMEKINSNLLTSANVADEEAKTLQRRLVRLDEVLKQRDQELFASQMSERNVRAKLDELSKELGVRDAQVARLEGKVVEMSEETAAVRAERAAAQDRARETGRQLAVARAENHPG
jgi:chromosome segregation ATPase